MAQTQLSFISKCTRRAHCWWGSRDVELARAEPKVRAAAAAGAAPAQMEPSSARSEHPPPARLGQCSAGPVSLGAATSRVPLASQMPLSPGPAGCEGPRGAQAQGTAGTPGLGTVHPSRGYVETLMRCGARRRRRMRRAGLLCRCWQGLKRQRGLNSSHR